MSPEELGRPTYTARTTKADPPQYPPPLSSSQPQPKSQPQPQPQHEPVVRQSRRKPPEQQEPVVERRKAKKQEPAADGVRTVYVPVVARPRIGYGLWRVVRFIAFALIWLVRTMVKIALSAFVHA